MGSNPAARRRRCASAARRDGARRRAETDRARAVRRETPRDAAQAPCACASAMPRLHAETLRERATPQRRGLAPPPGAAARRARQRIGDERARADAAREEPFGLQLRERVVDRVARDAPVRGELARGRQPRAAAETALDDRGKAGLVDLVAQTAFGGDAGRRRAESRRGRRIVASDADEIGSTAYAKLALAIRPSTRHAARRSTTGEGPR